MLECIYYIYYQITGENEKDWIKKMEKNNLIAPESIIFTPPLH